MAINEGLMVSTIYITDMEGHKMDVSYFLEINEDRLGTPNKATFKLMIIRTGPRNNEVRIR